jgi:hypothetical protein
LKEEFHLLVIFLFFRLVVDWNFLMDDDGDLMLFLSADVLD